MEDHDSLSTGFQQRRGRIRAWGLVAPGRRKTCVDENGPDQSYDAQSFRERIHHAASTSIRNATGTTSRTAAETGEQRLLASTRSRRRCAETPAAEIRTLS